MNAVVRPVPDPPNDLVGKYAREYWETHAPLLVQEGVLSPVHYTVFRVACEQWQIYRAAGDALGMDPAEFVRESSKGDQVIKPLVHIRDQALNQLTKLWMKLGLTPHALVTMNKQRGVAGSTSPAIAKFAAEKYGEEEE